MHLCGNDGVTEETIRWLSKRIRGKPREIADNILPLKKVKPKSEPAAVTQVVQQVVVKKEQKEEEKKQDVFKLFASNAAIPSTTTPPLTPKNSAFKIVDPKI